MRSRSATDVPPYFWTTMDNDGARKCEATNGAVKTPRAIAAPCQGPRAGCAIF
jgi:hypothetical protein